MQSNAWDIRQGNAVGIAISTSCTAYHDLVLLAAEANKVEIVLRVQAPYASPRFDCEWLNLLPIILSNFLLESRADHQSFMVCDDHTKDTFVRVDALERLFHLG